MMMKNIIQKSRRNDPSDTGGGWEVIYSGFVLILLCFFIMLCSFSSVEETKIKSFVESFVNAVGILPGGVGNKPGTVSNNSPKIVDKESELSGMYKNLMEVILEHELENDVDFSFSDEGVIMTLSDTALFKTGLAEISPKAIPMLKKIGCLLSGIPYDVSIAGHTDNIPIHTNTYDSNWDLSAIRAVNVLRYFVEEEKIIPQRLSAVGFGEFHPMTDNDSPAHRAENRRVEIEFFKKSK